MNDPVKTPSDAECPAPAERCAWKQYIAPELVVYGRLVDLTRAANDPPADALGGGSIQTG